MAISIISLMASSLLSHRHAPSLSLPSSLSLPFSPRSEVIVPIKLGDHERAVGLAAKVENCAASNNALLLLHGSQR